MKFSPGVSAVTLAGGRTHHRILPSHEGQHALRWFIHDPVAMFAKGDDLDGPHQIEQASVWELRCNIYISNRNSAAPSIYEESQRT
jgi:hypothetical protein